MVVKLENAGIAFLMVVIAGLATGIGAAVVFCEKLVSLASKRMLAASLAFSAGIMLYVSFIEIFHKAKQGFVDAGIDDKHAYMLSTLCMFGGMLLMRLLTAVTRVLDPGQDDFQIMVPDSGASEGLDNSEAAQSESSHASNPADPKKRNREKKLLRMGLNTALAITIHNVPEGVAGMVAGLIDPTVGFTLVAAIAIHNIPEGLCIALPIYYSTGSRLMGFVLAILSGLAEPIGAFIAWAIVAASGEDLNGVVYGILFGIVAGIMIMIVAVELLPTAHRYDPKDTVATHGLAAGMLVMAMSLVLFLM
mmetsp:Transcript_6012/g.10928  ORF Transcript_6012/g.10928 Transcript_6012/m.10928 type:complete len:306 (-) Transcript_6012:392-1309(-)